METFSIKATYGTTTHAAASTDIQTTYACIDSETSGKVDEIWIEATGAATSTKVGTKTTYLRANASTCPTLTVDAVKQAEPTAATGVAACKATDAAASTVDKCKLATDGGLLTGI